MEMKKSLQADLERERTTFFLLGFTVALATLFVLLEWNTEGTASSDWSGLSTYYMENSLPSEELSIQTPVETTIELPEKTGLLPETQPVVYEDFNPVEKPVAEEKEVIAQLFEESVSVQIQKPQLTHEEILRELDDLKMAAEADIFPQYPGGSFELNRFLFRNTVYPADALRQKIQGPVWCSFIVNRDGSIVDVRVEKGVYVSLNQEAIRVLQLMPAWTPAMQNGKPVRVKCYLPLVFRL